MGETADYELRAVIVAKDATGPGAKEAERNLVRVEERATAAGLGIGRLFALIGGAAGLGSAVRSIIGINSAIQDTTNGLATLYSAMTGADIGSSFRAAQSDIAGLREDARKGVGELSDYTDAFQRVLAPGLAAGASRAALRDLTRNSIAAAGAAGRPLWQAGSDLQQALTSGAHQRTTPIVSLALAAAGISEVKFNAESAAKRIEDMNRAFATFGPGVALMGKSWNAQLSTFTDNLKSVVGAVGKPLFDRWTRDLTAVNGWLDKNRDRLAEIAETWGHRLVKMWDTIIARAGTYAAILAATQLAPGVVGLARGASGAVSSAGSFLGGAFSGGVGAGIGALGAAASEAILPLAAVAGGVLAVRGAMRDYPADLAMIAGKANVLSGSLSALVGSVDGLTAPGSALNIVGDLMLKIGGAALDGADGLTRLAASIIVITGSTLQFLGSLAAAGAAIGRRDFAALLGIKANQDKNDAAMWASLGKVWQSPAQRKAEQDSEDNRRRFIERTNGKGGDLPPVTKPSDNVFNGPVTVNVKTEINSDPARVVDTWHKGMDRIRQAAVQAQRVPALSGA